MDHYKENPRHWGFVCQDVGWVDVCGNDRIYEKRLFPDAVKIILKGSENGYYDGDYYKLFCCFTIP